MRKPGCPLWGLSGPHPGQEDSALRAESVGQAQSPGWWVGQRPDSATSASSRGVHGDAPGLGRGCAPYSGHTLPSPRSVPPRLPPRFLLRLPQRPRLVFPPESISCCCLDTSICSAFRGMLLRGDRGMGAPPDSWPLSLPHANIPVVPVRADQACLVWSAVDATGLVCVGLRAD